MASYRRRARAEAEDRARQHGGLSKDFDSSFSRVAADASKAEARFAAALAEEAESLEAEGRRRRAADEASVEYINTAMARLRAIALEFGGEG